MGNEAFTNQSFILTIASIQIQVTSIAWFQVTSHVINPYYDGLPLSVFASDCNTKGNTYVSSVNTNTLYLSVPFIPCYGMYTAGQAHNSITHE